MQIAEYALYNYTSIYIQFKFEKMKFLWLLRAMKNANISEAFCVGIQNCTTCAILEFTHHACVRLQQFLLFYSLIIRSDIEMVCALIQLGKL